MSLDAVPIWYPLIAQIEHLPFKLPTCSPKWYFFLLGIHFSLKELIQMEAQRGSEHGLQTWVQI